MKKLILAFALALPLVSNAQKITLGSCTMKDGAVYKGEMSGGKPNGKGTASFPLLGSNGHLFYSIQLKIFT